MSLLYYYIQKNTNLFLKVWIIWSVNMVNFSKCMLIKEVEDHVTPAMIRGLGHRRSGMLNARTTYILTLC